MISNVRLLPLRTCLAQRWIFCNVVIIFKHLKYALLVEKCRKVPILFSKACFSSAISAIYSLSLAGWRTHISRPLTAKTKVALHQTGKFFEVDKTVSVQIRLLHHGFDLCLWQLKRGILRNKDTTIVYNLWFLSTSSPRFLIVCLISSAVIRPW